jgi:hypothetical protein
VGGFRIGLVIGILSTAVIALGIAVFVLATNDYEPTAKTASSGAADQAQDTCLIPHNPEGESAQIEVDLRSSGLACTEARDIFYALQGRQAINYLNTYEEPEREKGWACYGHPLAMHPVMVHCSSPGHRFLVLSPKPSARLEGSAPPPLPPAGTQVECGDLADEGAGTYSVKGNGVDCDTARSMAYTWETICLGMDVAPNPCPVIRRFNCSQSEVAIELVSITCVRGRHAVTFENGA